MKEELYNHEEKEEFLDTIESEDIKSLYYYLFSRSKGAEILYQKDLYSFTVEQLGDVMRNVNPSTMNSVANIKSRINSYITWAIRNGRRLNNINPVQGLSRDWGKNFIDKTAKRHLTDSEIYDLVEDLNNYQDKALIQCIYEGIMGQGLSELLSMNYNETDFENNIVTVRDSKTEQKRNVKVSDRCMYFIKEAYMQQTYLSEKTGAESTLIPIDSLIFKNTQWRSSKFDRISRLNLAKRIYTIKEKYELEEFTANTISQSGMIKMAADVFKEQGKLEREEFTLIGDHFNIPKTRVGKYVYHDISKMKYYISENNLKQLYGIEVNFE